MKSDTMSTKCAHEASTTHVYIVVEGVAVNSTNRYIVLTTRDTTTGFVGNDNATNSDVTGRSFTCSDIAHVQFIIVSFGTVRLKFGRYFKTLFSY